MNNKLLSSVGNTILFKIKFAHIFMTLFIEHETNYFAHNVKFVEQLKVINIIFMRRKCKK